MILPINNATRKAIQVSILYCNIKDKQMMIDKIGNKGTNGVLNSPALGIPFSFRKRIKP